MPLHYYYKARVDEFISESEQHVLGMLTQSSRGRQSSVESTQTTAWIGQIRILREALDGLGDELKRKAIHTPPTLYMEFSIPRMGSRADVVLHLGQLLIILEFKVGEKQFTAADVDQVWDYALDLKNFHKSSHSRIIVPVLCVTNAKRIGGQTLLLSDMDRDGVLRPLKTNATGLKALLVDILDTFSNPSDTTKFTVFARPPQIHVFPARPETPHSASDPPETPHSASANFVNEPTEKADNWDQGSYQPTPTIIEAAMALYNRHTVEDITRSDAGAENLTKTSVTVQQIIEQARSLRQKAIVFVTGVPGAGKTLVGLNIATLNMDADSMTHSVYLSGNGPLVDILREALARDHIQRSKAQGQRPKKKDVLRRLKLFIQNVHHYRDEYLRDPNAPSDHVAIFDEAQRAWNREMTSDFMKRKKGRPDFQMSEPEYLISCLDRHEDWAVVVCLVGGGQEINRGEAGIREWLQAIQNHFPDWRVYISDRLADEEYAAGQALAMLKGHNHVETRPELHLAVSMRSFRAEYVSAWVKAVLDLDVERAREHYRAIQERYPIVLTRDLDAAKSWLRRNARGSERYGMIVSSQAERLKPLSIHVRAKVNPIHWFLNEKDDVRSSYFLEDVATEFQVQGLELDWACVTWDADMRFKSSASDWTHHSFRGNRWQNIHSSDRKDYLRNAYRVLLTRARQGMVIVVPRGNPDDRTRQPSFYDETFHYLKSVGVVEI